jgi:D-alanyl-D-alanine endopeptidase (penicillin-binding protein 7)
MKPLLSRLAMAAAFALAAFAPPVTARMAKVSVPPASIDKATREGIGQAQGHRGKPSQVHALAALRSGAVLILDPATHQVLYQRNANRVMPIASVTKLMSALVVIGARQNMDDMLVITKADVDRLKYSSSRLRVGTRLTRAAMLHIALMSSENRAASALGRYYPGGTARFVVAMNAKARMLGMRNTRFVEPTGLSSANVSTPEDLARLVVAAQQQELIRQYSTDRAHTIVQGRHRTEYRNTNRLIASAGWHIGMQKTGYIAEAGRCMVLHAGIKGRAVVMVFLDAQGKFSRARDANRVRSWLVGNRAGKQG